MKTKKLFEYFLIIFLGLFTNLNPIANTEQDEKNIDDYIGLSTLTPLEFCTKSIDIYFQDLCNMNKHNLIPIRKSGPNSKTDLFNKRFRKYVRELYNSRDYSEFLSHDGTHIIEFMKLSKELNLGIESLYTCLRLFYNKMKEVILVDAEMVDQVLSEFSNLLESYFKEEDITFPSSKSLVKKIEKIILFKFTDHLDKFQEKPGAFISNLSQKIGQITQYQARLMEKKYDSKELTSRLRQIVIKFSELTLNRLIWYPENYTGIWSSTISISNNIQRLAIHKILDHMDDLDDLLWSLTHRFSFFLDLAGSSLPLSFYEEVESDIKNNLVSFLDIEEQDPEIKTKKEVLLQNILAAKVKAVAFQNKKIFTDQICINS